MMSRKSCLVKISGDMFNNDVLQWIKTLSQKYFVVVCVGGGTQINEAFGKANLPVSNFGPLGREANSFEERQLARNVLEENQMDVQDRLDEIGARVSVVLPVLDIGSVLCHVNGDQFVITAYHGFDILYVVTTYQRANKKRKIFAKYSKVEVMEFKT